MGVIPPSLRATPPANTLSSVGLNSIGAVVLNSGLTSASTAWPSANRTIYVPLFIDRTVTITQMFAYNGATASGNTDIGIYDQGGTRLVSMGATAQSGTSQIQLFNITDTTLTPGAYFMGMSNSGTTGTYFRAALGVTVMGVSGCYQDASSLPSSMGFTSPASAYLPIFGAVRGTI